MVWNRKQLRSADGSCGRQLSRCTDADIGGRDVLSCSRHRRFGEHSVSVTVERGTSLEVWLSAAAIWIATASSIALRTFAIKSEYAHPLHRTLASAAKGFARLRSASITDRIRSTSRRQYIR